MKRSWVPGAGLVVAGALLTLLSGCPLHFQNEPRPNTPPRTFFDRPPPARSVAECGSSNGGFPEPQQHSAWITFSDEVSFTWQGTDLDNDVVAYQYQLVETDSTWYLSGGLQGSVIRSIDPRSESPEEQWTPRLTDTRQVFRDLLDGWYEFRVRAIDEAGLPSDKPALSRFQVFFDDEDPVPVIVNRIQQCGRLGGQSQARFQITATDLNRSGTTPRSQLQYHVRLQATDQQSQCLGRHISDPFTEWTCFPSDDPNDVVTIGAEAPTDYNDLNVNKGCEWTFTYEVRDPAGNKVATSCAIKQE